MPGTYGENGICKNVDLINIQLVMSDMPVKQKLNAPILNSLFKINNIILIV